MEEKFKFVKKGYDPVEVNKYINSLEEIISSYKEKDSAIKNAILNAQIAADNIVMNAESKADIIIRNAEIGAGSIKSDALSILGQALKAFETQKQYIDSLRQDYDFLIQKYVGQYKDDDAVKLISDVEEIEKYMGDIRELIDKTKDYALQK